MSNQACRTIYYPDTSNTAVPRDFHMDRVLRAIKIFCAAGKIFFKNIAVTHLKEKSLSEQEGEMRRRQNMFLLSRFF